MTARRHTTLDFPTPGIARLVLDHAERSVNVLCQAMLAEFEAHLDTLDQRDDIHGLVILSGNPGSYIAGADLTEFLASLDHPEEAVLEVCHRGQQLFGRLSKTDYVTVAGIDGICVGGGAEMAIWCDRRIVTQNKKTQYGFPEVKLGLFPGWGGTARTPRIVGLSNAVELVTSGKFLSGKECYELGLADDLLPESASPMETLYEAAVRMIQAEHPSGAYQRDRQRWSQPLAMSETELAFLGATAVAVIQQETKGHYPAPLAALEVMLEASMVDLDTALEMEATGFAPLFGSEINRALLNVFFLQDRNKKSFNDRDPDTTPNAIPARSLGVVGAGTMGQGIASVALRRGLSVTLSDNRPEALIPAQQKVLQQAAYDRQLKAPSAEKVLELAPQLVGTDEINRVAECDIVVEAVIEDVHVKQALFNALEPYTTDNTILCTNTSTIPITKLAEGLQDPESFCGLHFFNPVRKMPLVEVIRGEKTSQGTIERAVDVARQLGKTPVVVNDGPGFLVNRLLMPYMNEAMLLLVEGVPLKAIEKAALSFGMPMGPLELHDVVGLDVCLHAGRVMQAAFADRVEPGPLITRLVDAGRLGQKNGRGFYDWETDRKGRQKKTPSDEVAQLVSSVSRPTEQQYDLTDRLMLPMLVEATRAVEEGIAADVRDVDLALIMGIGFPPFRGGLFFWADRLGAATLREKLEQLQPLGKRYEPTDLIRQHAAAGTTFYPAS